MKKHIDTIYHKKSCCKPSTVDGELKTPFRVGGMAFADGVLMRTENFVAVAGRDLVGKMHVFVGKIEPLHLKYKFLKWPFIRGLVFLYETLKLRKDVFKLVPQIGLPERKLGCFGILNKIFWYLLTFTFLIFSLGLSFKFLQDRISGPSLNIAYFLVQVLLLIVAMIAVLIISFSWSLLIPIFRYHGAEHKTVNAFEAGEIMTPLRVKKYPRIHKRCGTNFSWFLILISFIIFPLLPLRFGWWNILLIIIYTLSIFSVSYEIFRLVDKFSHTWWAKILLMPALWIQHLTTLEPSEKQIEVAIVALKEVVKRERKNLTIMRRKHYTN